MGLADSMAEALIQKKKVEGEHEIVLRLLEQVLENNSISQAEFAKRIGIAKGLANAYFNRCLQKGWIKLRQVPKQRYLYYLTPTGFTEKARLAAEFLTSSYQFYREARADFVDVMASATAQGHQRLAALGAGELAEIALIVSDGASIKIVGFLDGDSARTQISGRPVARELSKLDAADAALLATLSNVAEVYSNFAKAHPSVPIYVPKQLRGLLRDFKK
jgi:DNA-binding MarR family transcriptional regulator